MTDATSGTEAAPCSAHLFSVVSPTGQQVDQWLSNTLEQLLNRYQIDVVNIAKGESNVYR